jgi:hypothetical protein
MGSRKTYEAHYPAADCSGGSEVRLHRVSGESVEFSPEALERKQQGDSIYSCSYRQFVWFQSSASRPGFDPTPAGYYENFRWPNEFHMVPRSFSIRQQNTSSHWYAYEEGLRKQRERRR